MLKNIICVINAVSLLCVFLVISIFTPTFDVNFYSKEYDKYQVPQSIGVPKNQLMAVTQHMLFYMLDKEPDLVVYADVNGERREFFNDREKAHMVDVKALFSFASDVFMLSVVMFPLTLAFYLKKKYGRKSICKANVITQILFIAMLALVAVVASIDFSEAFDTFHHIFFTNDLWELDPATDLLINIVPLEFFIDIAIRVGLIFVSLMLCSVIFFSLTWKKLLFKRRQRSL